MKSRILLLVLFILVAAGDVSAATGEAQSFGHEVVLEGGAVVWMTQNGDERGRLQFTPAIAEMEIVSGPPITGDDASVLWLKARSKDYESTGLHIRSRYESQPGSVGLYVDGKTFVRIVEGGLMVLPDSVVYFGDREHYLARCGEDLCWTNPEGETVVGGEQ